MIGEARGAFPVGVFQGLFDCGQRLPQGRMFKRGRQRLAAIERFRLREQELLHAGQHGHRAGHHDGMGARGKYQHRRQHADHAAQSDLNDAVENELFDRRTGRFGQQHDGGGDRRHPQLRTNRRAPHGDAGDKNEGDANPQRCVRMEGCRQSAEDRPGQGAIMRSVAAPSVPPIEPCMTMITVNTAQ